MPFPRTIRNYNAFMDGGSFAGLVTKASLPELALSTADFRGGGMDGSVAIDMGQEAMAAELEFKEWSRAALTRWARPTRLVLRAGEMGEDDFEATPLVFTLGGRVTKQVGGDLQGGQESLLTLTWNVTYFRVERDGETLTEIDVERAVRIVDGTDQLAALRRAMGV